MRLPILALFDRSLREESRLVSTYARRLVLLVIILVLLIGAHDRSARVGAAGLGFFEAVVYTSLLFISMAGLTYFASAITEEKEEATLGLLKMSNLNGVSILLGKSTSRLLGVTMLVIAQLPFTLLAVTLGGVSLTQVFAAYATLLAYLVLLCNVALFTSVRQERTSTAAVLAGIAMGLFLVGGPIGQTMLPLVRLAPAVYAIAQSACEFLNTVSPLVRINEIMTTGFDGEPVGRQVLSNLALGAGFFALSWATFGHYTRETKEAGPARTALIGRWSLLRLFGVSRPWRAALAWKDFHFLTGGRLMIVVRIVVLLGLVGAVAWLHQINASGPVPAELVGGTLMFCALGLAALDLAGYVSRMFRQEIQWHTLPDLALLPVSMHRLFWSKFLGVLPSLVPYVVAFFVGAMLCPREFGYGLEGVLGTIFGWHAICQFIAFVFFAAYLSLLIKRAGVLTAGAIWFVGNQVMFFLLFVFLRPGGMAAVEGMFFVLSILFLVFAARMYKAAIARLERLAGE